MLYNLIALRIERLRQRPRRDANLWLWQASHVMISAAFLAWLSGAPASLTGSLLLGGALSFVVGSLIRIVPFLSWLDLQQRRIAARCLRVKLPRLRQLLTERSANLIALTLGAGILVTLVWHNRTAAQSSGRWTADGVRRVARECLAQSRTDTLCGSLPVRAWPTVVGIELTGSRASAFPSSIFTIHSELVA